MILVVGVIIASVTIYSNKSNEISSLKTELEKSQKEFTRVKNEAEGQISKSNTLLQENKDLVAELDSLRKNIAELDGYRDTANEKMNMLIEQKESLKNDLTKVRHSYEKQFEVEKKNFEKELKATKEGYVDKLQNVVQQIEDLRKKSDFLAQKKEILENVIIQAMADVGRERMKLYHYQKGLSYESNKRYEEAIEEYNKVLKIDPNNSNTYLQLASIYTYQMRDLEKAEIYAKEYARLEPQSKIGMENIQGRDVKLSLPYLKDKLADVALMNVNLETKIADMKEVVKKKQELVNNLHDIAKKNKIVTHQLKQIEESVKKETLKFHYNLAVMYDRSGDYQNACKEYLESLKVASNDTDTHYNLAIIYDDHLDDKKKAIEHYQKYLELCPTSEDAKKVEYWIVRAEEEQRSK